MTSELFTEEPESFEHAVILYKGLYSSSLKSFDEMKMRKMQTMRLMRKMQKIRFELD